MVALWYCISALLMNDVFFTIMRGFVITVTVLISAAAFKKAVDLFS
ncbi:MAG: hypothetical protein MJ055_04870 [Phascolarctobacterium sp.]|nr:hypothetical protein [Phascolarctobacterium sp.]